MATIRMTRDEPAHEGGPVSADVHPDEVGNMEKAGWTVIKTEKPAPADEFSQAFDAMEGEPDAWTSAGLPKIDRLSELLGRAISAGKRDREWARYVKARSGNGADA